MQSLKKYLILRRLVILFLMSVITFSSYTQETTPQVMIETRFIVVNQQDFENIGMSMDILGDNTVKVDAIDLDIGTGWDPTATPALLPDGRGDGL